MEDIIKKEEINEIMKIEGEIRGVGIINIIDFLIKEKGEKSVERLEELMKNVNFPVEYKKMKPLDFYPLKLLQFTLLGIKRLFDLPDEKFQEMGDFQVKTSAILRLFGKFLLSLKMASENVQEMFNTYFSVGNIKTTELDEVKKYAVVKLENFPLHPLHAYFLRGYFASLVSLIVKTKTMCEKMNKSEDEKKGVYYFLIKWD